MEAIHPGVGAVLAQWWIDAQSQPYTTGWTRMAFRVRGHPEVTREGRARGLRSMVQALGPYPDRDIAWVAAWAPFLGFDYGWSSFSRFAIGDACGLLATAIDTGGEAGDAVFDTLVEVGNGEHGIGVMGRHVISGLLRSHREDGWDYVMRLLRAAQRQEGLRQAILEAADEATPGAFDRLVQMVLDEDLLRFAAAVRAAGVWIGTGYDVEQTAELRGCLEFLRTARADSAVLAAAIEAGEPSTTYLALCATAMSDALEATDAAARVVRTREAAARGSAIRFLSRVSLPAARRVLIEAVDDEDLAVAWLAYEGAALGRYSTDDSDPLNALLYDAMLRLLPRVPETDVMIEVPGTAAQKVEVSRSGVVSTLFDLRADRPLSEFVAFVPLHAPDDSRGVRTGRGVAAFSRGRRPGRVARHGRRSKPNGASTGARGPSQGPSRPRRGTARRGAAHEEGQRPSSWRAYPARRPSDIGGPRLGAPAVGRHRTAA